MEVWGPHPLLHASTSTSKWCQDGIQKDRPALPFSSGKEERSPLPWFYWLSATWDSAWIKGQGRLQSPGGSFPRLSTQRTGRANTGPDAGAGFPPLSTLTISHGKARGHSRGDIVYSAGLLPSCHDAMGSVDGQRRGAGWITACLSVLVYLSKQTP